MKSVLVFVSLFMLVAVGSSSVAQATIINAADVNGFTTFQDLNTNRVWLDMNNFFQQSPNVMIPVATAAGFTVANRADVAGLLSTLTLNDGEWSSYNSIMGGAPNRPIIWGAYDAGSTENVGWAWAESNDLGWRMDFGSSYSDIPNLEFSPLLADMNLWAYRSGESTNAVPEPMTLSLLGMGLLGLGLSRKRVI